MTSECCGEVVGNWAMYSDVLDGLGDDSVHGAKFSRPGKVGGEKNCISPSRNKIGITVGSNGNCIAGPSGLKGRWLLVNDVAGNSCDGSAGVLQSGPPGSPNEHSTCCLVVFGSTFHRLVIILIESCDMSIVRTIIP